MKLTCSKCSGFAQGGTLFLDDGIDCPICGRKDEGEGQIIGEEKSGGTRKEEESGGPR